MSVDAIIWTEGKTDWQHIKSAFQVLGVGGKLKFEEYDDDFGDDQLLKQCSALARILQPLPTIFIFDRDNDEIVRKVATPDLGFKQWGNNVYSFAIPVPAHRNGQSAICVESYYTDDELRIPDEKGRRLFLSTEFNPKSGRHLIDSSLSIGNKGKLTAEGKSARVRIVDSEVYDDQSNNVALSKADFTKNVVSRAGAFGTLRFEAFLEIKTVIDKIIDQGCEKIDLPFSDLELFFNNLEQLDTAQQFVEVVKAAIRVCKLASMTFVAATFRHYEQRIIEESNVDIKKVRPIKQVLDQSFGQPGLATLHKLTKHCYYLVDERAPSAVCTLRAVMAANPLLGSIGNLLDDLEKVFPPPSDQVRIVNKSKLRKPIMDYLLPEFAKYESRISDKFVLPKDSILDGSDLSTWKSALSLLIEYMSPLRSLTFRVRKIERVRNDSDEFDVLMTTFQDERVSIDTIKQTYEDLDNNRIETYELLISEEERETVLDLFPFIVIKENKLLFYSQTKARGFEYNVVFGFAGYVEPTKRKFSHVALRKTIVSDLQGLFWAQVTPTSNELGIKANIPPHGPIVGRKQQLSDIMDQIIDIPNQNGIVYGPGGVGKTALLIELCKQLFDAVSPNTVNFQNIIWVSAKPNYYDPTLDRVDARLPQFQSLDNVLTALLEFHEYEDANTYNADEKKSLVLELLRDAKTLLILDNFESVSRAGQEDILKFFGLTTKQALRDKPDFFKVLITSREVVPSGFHQFKLKGLDKRESKQLMRGLYKLYVQSGRQQLTLQQQDAVYETTQGIPIIIKHCYGQVFEYGIEIDVVIKNLSTAGTKVVDFSFSEVFNLLKKDELHLRIILLLELSGRRLMSRQIADILLVDEAEIAGLLAQLVNFQCANLTSSGTEEKYGINDDVRLLTRRLTLEYATLAMEIKHLIANLAMDKRMDYTQAEFDAVLVFDDYLSQGHYLLAENFISEELEESPKSILLNLHYSKYLKEVKRRTPEAIERLVAILELSGYDQQVLRLLMAYYIALEIPNYEQAHSYARELEDASIQNNEIKAELAQFYVAWSTALKMKVDFDPLKEMLRRQKYKELAETAINLLKNINQNTHEWYYLMAQSYFNCWDYELALPKINKAIEALPKGSHLESSYQRLQREILKKQGRFTKRQKNGLARA
jgi:RNA-directed DNA polymerase